MVLGPNINTSNCDKFLDSMENDASYEKIVFHISNHFITDCTYINIAIDIQCIFISKFKKIGYF